MKKHKKHRQNMNENFNKILKRTDLRNQSFVCLEMLWQAYFKNLKFDENLKGNLMAFV